MQMSPWIVKISQLQLLAREQVLYIEEPFKDISMLDDVVDGTIPPMPLMKRQHRCWT